MADGLGAPAPAPDQHQLSRVAPLLEQGEGAQDADHVLARLEGGDEQQVALGQPGRLPGVREQVGVDALVDGVDEAAVEAEAVLDLVRRRVGHRDQAVGVAQGAGQTAPEAGQGLRRDGLGHGGEGEIVHRRHLGAAEGLLLAVEEEVGREEHVVAVEEAQQRLDHPAQDQQGRADREQEPGRDLVHPEPHVAGARHRRRRRLVRREKGLGIEVVAEPVVTAIERREQVPLVPPDPGHVLEEGVGVDGNGRHLLGQNHPALESPPAGAQRSREVAGDRREEAQGRHDASEHGEIIPRQDLEFGIRNSECPPARHLGFGISDFGFPIHPPGAWGGWELKTQNSKLKTRNVTHRFESSTAQPSNVKTFKRLNDAAFALGCRA